MKHLMISIAALALCANAWAEEPFAGTWKLNLAKSKFPAGTAPKEETFVIREIAGGQVEQTTNGTATDGKPIALKRTVNQAGGVWKYQLGGPPAGTMGVVLKISSREAYNTVYVNEKMVSQEHDTLSGDGKELHAVVKGVDPQGKAFEITVVADRQ